VAIERAEALNSPSARSAAYWNASMAHAQRGQVREAVPMAAKALSLLSEGGDTRNLARLRVDLARLQLRAGQDLTEAVSHLQYATRDLEAASAGAVDLAAGKVALADARLQSGDQEGALVLGAEVEAMQGEEIAHERAEAVMVRGQIEVAQGHRDRAKESYRRAADILASSVDDRFNAQLWFDLAELLQEVGEIEQAHLALQVAARASGLQSRRQRLTAGAAVSR
jgi:tetratricopeptide (TPR) repeat protein